MGGDTLELRPEQKVLVDKISTALKRLPFYLCIAEMRSGKTYIALGIAKALGFTRILITCPKSVVPFWQETVKAFGLEAHILPYSLLSVRDVKKEKQKIYEYMIIDEIHNLRRYSSRTRAAMKLASMSEYRLGLTGTPLNRDELELYYPLKVLTQGQEVEDFPIPSTKEMWNTTWGVLENPYSDFPTYKLTKRHLFYQGLLKFTLYRRNEKIAVPKTMLLKYKLTERQRRYISLLEDGAFEIDDCRFLRPPSQVGVATMRTKMEQIQSGFLIDDREETHKFASDKWTTLKEHLNPEHLTIIWYKYIAERDKILELFPETSLLWQKAGDEKKLGEGKTKILVCHTASAGAGIEIGQADRAYYTGFFSDYINLKQSNYRLVSQSGATEKVNFLLMSDGALDSIRLSALRKKEATFQSGYAHSD